MKHEECKQLYPVKNWIDHMLDHAPKAPCAVGAQYMECIIHFNTLCIFTKEPIREWEIKLECMNVIFLYVYIMSLNSKLTNH